MNCCPAAGKLSCYSNNTSSKQSGRKEYWAPIKSIFIFYRQWSGILLWKHGDRALNIKPESPFDCFKWGRARCTDLMDDVTSYHDMWIRTASPNENGIIFATKRSQGVMPPLSHRNCSLRSLQSLQNALHCSRLGQTRKLTITVKSTGWVSLHLDDAEQQIPPECGDLNYFVRNWQRRCVVTSHRRVWWQPYAFVISGRIFH